MTQVSYDKLVPSVVMQAPNCPEFTAVYALRMAAVELCQESHLLMHTMDPIDVIAGEATYDFDVPRDTEAMVVKEVWLEDRPLAPLGESSKNKWPWLRLDSRNVRPAGYTQNGNTSLTLTPVPDKDYLGGLIIRLAIMPTFESTTIDSDLISVWTDTLINGALARLYMIPNQPFTNFELAKVREVQYRQDVVKAKIHANKALTTASLRVQPRQP